MKNLVILMLLAGLNACAMQTAVTGKNKGPEVLTVQKDGTMILNDRTMNEKDVIIYPDGFGGERAAVRVHVPLKSDFYRDTIRVQREEITEDPSIKQN
jgi:hypothetical protein